MDPDAFYPLERIKISGEHEPPELDQDAAANRGGSLSEAIEPYRYQSAAERL
jgi:hypothetical protein